MQVPAPIPVATPTALTNATAPLLVVQESVVELLLVSVVLLPSQTTSAPVIEGRAFTVTTAVAAQPVAPVYATMVVPAAMPLTTPVALTEPIAGVLLLHTPPAGELVRAVVPPMQTLLLPANADGAACTEMIVDAEQPPFM